MLEYLTEYFNQISWDGIIGSSLRILITLILLWVTSKLFRSALGRFEQRLIHTTESRGDKPGEASKRAETLVRLLRQGVIILLWVVGLLIILRELGLDITPILASAGILGLAVGFGAQNLVRDVISGFFFILENQVRVGDVAIVNGTGGLVEGVNFRTIVLRDLAGVVHVFPNGSITTLSNLTHDWSAYVFDIGVAYKEDVDRVIALLKEIGEEMRNDDYYGPLLIDDIEIFGVNEFADSAVMIKGRLLTQPIKQWEVGREFLRRVKIAFDKADIEIPFPHRSLYFGEASNPVLAQILNTKE